MSTDRQTVSLEASTGNGGPWPARVGHIDRSVGRLY